MAKRISTEARLLDWIDTAPIEVVTSIMGIAVARWKVRARKEQPPQQMRQRKIRVPVVGTAFPGGEVKTA